MFSDQNRKCVRHQISLCRQLLFKNGFLHKIKRESHFNSSNGDTKASLTLSRSLKGVLIASILKKLTFRFHEFHEKSYSMAKNLPMWCETSPKIQTKRGKTCERNSKQKNWPENEPKSWPGLPWVALRRLPKCLRATPLPYS